jgi:hypothetical protein
VSEALAPLFLVASVVLCLAGLTKLRAPAAAAAALGVGTWLIRAVAAGEVALGAVCLIHPTSTDAVALAMVYGLFALVAVRLRRERMACGCFGDNDFPVSLAHVIASGLLGVLAMAAALATPRGLIWLASQPVPVEVVLSVGVVGALYGVLIVYTMVPRAWAAWSGE